MHTYLIQIGYSNCDHKLYSILQTQEIQVAVATTQAVLS